MSESMLDFEDALRMVLAKAPLPSKTQTIRFAQSLGAVLAEEVFAAEDFPSFAKSMMDGFACRSKDIQNSPTVLTLIGESRAGLPFQGQIDSGQAVGIYTGAALPAGADVVVPVEKTQNVGENKVQIQIALAVGAHIAKQGEDAKSGEKLFGPATKITPQVLATMAAVGHVQVKVFQAPQITILPTGDELIDPQEKPDYGQIRESNSFAIEAQARAHGFKVQRMPVAPDEPAQLKQSLARAYAAGDCLLIIGGISAGKYDYVAQALDQLGVQKHFHGVNLKPGKPVWFGSKDEKIVFGLPGNPVSAFVIFELLARPAMERMAGLSFASITRYAALQDSPIKKNPRLQFVPAVCQETVHGPQISALAWISSGDFFTLARANALLKIPANSIPSPGSLVEFVPL